MPAGDNSLLRASRVILLLLLIDGVAGTTSFRESLLSSLVSGYIPHLRV